ncbi:MAG: hypothetical protein HYX61_03545 [Gammaproteobacteria bacterium]|jgi:hypothetical protein|nr:hypothetical protein [Gammaproteobacteria bacterium]
MKTLDISEIKLISGAANLVITQMIPTNDVSDLCLAVLVQTFQNGYASSLPEEQLEALVLASCSINELDLLFDRMDVISPCKVEFI